MIIALFVIFMALCANASILDKNAILAPTVLGSDAIIATSGLSVVHDPIATAKLAAVPTSLKFSGSLYGLSDGIVESKSLLAEDGLKGSLGINYGLSDGIVESKSLLAEDGLKGSLGINYGLSDGIVVSKSLLAEDGLKGSLGINYGLSDGIIKDKSLLGGLKGSLGIKALEIEDLAGVGLLNKY